MLNVTVMSIVSDEMDKKTNKKYMHIRVKYTRIFPKPQSAHFIKHIGISRLWNSIAAFRTNCSNYEETYEK